MAGHGSEQRALQYQQTLVSLALAEETLAAGQLLLLGSDAPQNRCAQRGAKFGWREKQKKKFQLRQIHACPCQMSRYGSVVVDCCGLAD